MFISLYQSLNWRDFFFFTLKALSSLKVSHPTISNLPTDAKVMMPIKPLNKLFVFLKNQLEIEPRGPKQ